MDPYATLEVLPIATGQDIQAAYRRLVLQWHPDHNRGCSEAEQRTKNLNVAYETLGDPDKRAEHDLTRAPWLSREATAAIRPLLIAEDLSVRLALCDDVEQQFRLGERFRGGVGVARDHKTAIEFYARAGHLGHVESCLTAGEMFKTGVQGEPDHERAVAWFLRAVKRGSGRAALLLAQCCREGQGVERNLDEAERLLQLAAERGATEARRELAELRATKKKHVRAQAEQQRRTESERAHAQRDAEHRAAEARRYKYESELQVAARFAAEAPMPAPAQCYVEVLGSAFGPWGLKIHFRVDGDVRFVHGVGVRGQLETGERFDFGPMPRGAVQAIPQGGRLLVPRMKFPARPVPVRLRFVIDLFGRDMRGEPQPLAMSEPWYDVLPPLLGPAPLWPMRS